MEDSTRLKRFQMLRVWTNDKLYFDCFLFPYKYKCWHSWEKTFEKCINAERQTVDGNCRYIPMIAPQCIFAYGSSPVKISHKTIPKENTSTCVYHILITYQAAMVAYARNDQECGGKNLPSQRLCCCYHSVTLVPSMEECRVHHQKPKCCAWFLTTQSPQPKN